MGASGSSRTTRRITSSANRMALVCHHGKPPVLRVSGTMENPGRRFWGCAYYDVRWVRRECDFFQWADRRVEDEQVVVAEDQEKAKLRRKVVALKVKLRAMERKMKISWFVGLVGWLGFLGLWMHK
ncbi:hypothetical protein PIB30_081559 [Stylosanthes scabra]|uniref:GRF-type domain-containing protein n=1 Tax=Stylosanthes scabra TaxID=79078 RepID=A0ABU6ZQD4_9FABA|nr:hypothetical protein [Stylosanthes scabra]